MAGDTELILDEGLLLDAYEIQYLVRDRGDWRSFESRPELRN